MINSKEINWLAGLLEGEGHFGYMSYTPRVDLWMNDEDVVNRVATMIGKAVSIRPAKGPKRAQHGFTVCGGRAIGVMLTLYGLLGARRRAAIRLVMKKWTAPRESRSSISRRVGHLGGEATFRKYGAESLRQWGAMGAAKRNDRG